MPVIHKGGVYRRVTADYMDAVADLQRRNYISDAKWGDLEDLLRQMDWTVEPGVVAIRNTEDFGTEPDGDLDSTLHSDELRRSDLLQRIGKPPYHDPQELADRLLSYMDAPKVKKKQPKGQWSKYYKEPAPWYYGATSKPPANLEPGSFHILSYSITPDSKMRPGATYVNDLVWAPEEGMRVSFTYINGVAGVTVTNSAGKSGFVAEPTGPALKEGYDTTSAKQRITKVLEKLKFKSAFKTWARGSAKTRKPTVTEMRTLENTGTCAICGRNVKLTRSGLMWDHGYTVPWGWGRTQGCFGVNKPPYEKSPKACEMYIEALEDLLVRTEEKLATADQIDKLPHPHKRGRRVEMIEPGHRNWDTAFQRYLGHLRQTLKMVPDEIKEMQTKVDNWELKPLPGERGR